MTKLHALSALFVWAFKNTVASILQIRDARETGVMDRAKWEGDAVVTHIGPEPDAVRSCGKRMTVFLQVSDQEPWQPQPPPPPPQPPDCGASAAAAPAVAAVASSCCFG